MIIKSLNPDPKKRTSIKELLKMVSESSKISETSSVFESEYTRVKRITHSFLTNMQDIHRKTRATAVFDIVSEYNDIHIVNTMYLVEQKETMRRYNAFCIAFLNESNAIKHFNAHIRQIQSIKHENIVPIENVI